MCYPKPGPRCSSHARTRLAEAYRNSEAAVQSGDPDAIAKAKEAVNAARADFDETPAGQKLMLKAAEIAPSKEERRSILIEREHAAARYREKLDRYKQKRAQEEQAELESIDTSAVKNQVHAMWTEKAKEIATRLSVGRDAASHDLKALYRETAQTYPTDLDPNTAPAKFRNGLRNTLIYIDTDPAKAKSTLIKTASAFAAANQN